MGDVYRKLFLLQTALNKAGDLFFALKGPNFDGNKYAEIALKKGAEYAIIDNPIYQKNDKYLLVDDVLETLQDLARHHRKHLPIACIAITGSNGKTTTKELLTLVLAKKYRTQATIGNYNNHIGVPLTILDILPNTEMAILFPKLKTRKNGLILKRVHGVIMIMIRLMAQNSASYTTGMRLVILEVSRLLGIIFLPMRNGLCFQNIWAEN